MRPVCRALRPSALYRGTFTTSGRPRVSQATPQDRIGAELLAIGAARLRVIVPAGCIRCPKPPRGEDYKSSPARPPLPAPPRSVSGRRPHESRDGAEISLLIFD